MLKSGILVFIISILSLTINSQDIHFSQFFNNPISLNPAETGFSKYRYRFFMNHRSQWSAVTVPYVTYSAVTDIQMIKRKYQNDIFSFGLIAHSDKAGDSEFGTNSASGSLSYIKSLNSNGSSILSFGAAFTYSQRSIDYSKLTFDNQYVGTVYIPQMGNGETFDLESFEYYDFSLGTKYYKAVSADLSFNFSLAAWHLNRPYMSFFNDESVRMPIKYVGIIEANYEYDRPNSISPAIFYARQGSWQEIMFGLQYKQVLDYSPIDHKAMNFGLYYRNKDALFFYFALDYKSMSFAVSYDMNISSLRQASNLRGGAEFSFIFNYTKNKLKKIEEIECPVF